MDSTDSSPPSPILSHATRKEAIDKQRRLHRSTSSSIQRHSKEHVGSSARELARLLLYEEREAKDLRKMLLTVTDQLKEESRRADDNERRAREIIYRYKAVEEARITAQADAVRANEELRLYKVQLEDAQREISKAQELLNSIEVSRHEAEASAARARTTARKIKEERLIDLAREEGRRLGLQEGLSRGRRVGFENGRMAGFEQGRSTSGARAIFLADEADPVASYAPDEGVRETQEERPLTPIDLVEEPMLNFPTPNPTAPPDPVPERISPARSRTSSHAPSVVAPEPSAAPPPGGYPTIVRSVTSPVRHPQNIIPPDGYIPRADADSMIRLPPPHEMQRAPPTPENPLSRISEEGSPLMVPNPAVRREHEPTPGPYGTRQDSASRRGTSPESQGSTTISQFELVSEPSRYRPMSGGLSVIQEVASGQPSPANGARSLSGDNLSRPPSTTRGSPSPAIIPVSAPTPQPANAIIANLEEQSRYLYRRPSSVSSTQSVSQKFGSAPRTPVGSDNRSLNNRTSSSIHITIEPPTRPSSQTPQATPALTHSDFLSAEDAARRPVPPPEPAPIAPMMSNVPSTVPAPSTTPSTPIPLPDGELPPGFMPIGPPIPTSTPSRTSTAYTGAGIPLPPSTVASTFYQLPSEPGSRASRGTPGLNGGSAGQPTLRSRQSRNGSSISDPAMARLPSTTATSSVVLPAPDLLSQPIGDSSSSTSDDEAIGSSIASSSADTLTTPPMHAKKRLSTSKGTSYDTAPLPAGLQYPSTPSVLSATPGNAARVPLPPSTSANTPRTTPSPYRSGMNVNAGMTPGVRHTSLRGSIAGSSGGREPKVHHRHSYQRFDGDAYLDPAYLASSDDLHETDTSA
ncbi:hypothetical protein EW146_g7156 [Bondarzewia mesenterica]|uniref:Uncharacterized protein n=1 Tax=Bondarzewia mesenterica TaxID=1095465 RepID=A0A4S4LNG3_9AGAM|nr:hypothetical protein EW146_g7156 [Bondarzewia mesenterica]